MNSIISEFLRLSMKYSRVNFSEICERSQVKDITILNEHIVWFQRIVCLISNTNWISITSSTFSNHDWDLEFCVNY